MLLWHSNLQGLVHWMSTCHNRHAFPPLGYPMIPMWHPTHTNTKHSLRLHTVLCLHMLAGANNALSACTRTDIRQDMPQYCEAHWSEPPFAADMHKLHCIHQPPKPWYSIHLLLLHRQHGSCCPEGRASAPRLHAYGIKWPPPKRLRLVALHYTPEWYLPSCQLGDLHAQALCLVTKSTCPSLTCVHQLASSGCCGACQELLCRSRWTLSRPA
jgi:hypothetical protein